MEFMICGSAAAEGWPAFFCECRCCQEAARRGGKNLRTRTAYQLGEEIRIDLGPDSLAQMYQHGIASERIRHLLVTHSHDDHWLPHELYWRRQGFSVVSEESVLTIYGNARVREKLHAALGTDLPFFRLAFQETQPGTPIALTPEVRATPIPAAHDRGEVCVFYVLQVGGKTLLQANDTGWLDPPAWEMLEGFRVDVAVIDCTYGKQDSTSGHLGAEAVVKMRDAMLERGILKPQNRVVANHFSHNGGWIHEELEEFFAPRGIETGFDGMRIAL